MTRYGVLLPNGGQLTFDCDRHVTHAVVLSPPNVARWRAGIEEQLDRARKIVRNLTRTGRSMRISHTVGPTGIDVVTLTTVDEPNKIILSHSNAHESSSAAEARLLAMAQAEFKVARDACTALRELLANLPDQDSLDTEYRIIASGGPEITGKIGDLSSYEEEGRTVSLDRVDIIDTASEAPKALSVTPAPEEPSVSA